jgi:outer membrane beta-barrel protein
MNRTNDNFRSLSWLLAPALLLVGPRLAAAQDDAEASRDASGVALEDTGLVETDPNPDADAPFRRVADEEESIYAIQQKAYLVKSKFEASLMFSALFNDRFVQSYAPVGSLTYYFGENFGLELFGGYLFPTESDATTELAASANRRPPFSSLTQLLWAAGIGAQWSPIYGKVRIAGNELGNFSFYVTGGFAVGQTRVQCIPNENLDPRFDQSNCPLPEDPTDDTAVVYEPETFRPMGVLGGGFRFYFEDWLGAKFEVRDYIFASRVYRPGQNEPGQATPTDLRYSDTIRNNLYLNIGISFLF